jgi:hypothetical protein
VIVYRITGYEIGPNGNRAVYFATKRSAVRALWEYRRLIDDVTAGGGPERLEIKGRRALVDALNSAMKYGLS